MVEIIVGSLIITQLSIVGTPFGNHFVASSQSVDVLSSQVFVKLVTGTVSNVTTHPFVKFAFTSKEKEGML